MKLNLCCGMDYREGYINIDFSDVGSDGNPIKVDLKCNILEGLPYQDNSIDEIVFRESLEHFNRHNGLKVLKEIHRVLKSGGLLDLSVPPAKEQLFQLLKWIDCDSSMKDFIEAHQRFTYWKWHDDLMGATHESDGNDGDSHKTLWPIKALVSVLENAGFYIIWINNKVELKAKKC